MTDKEKRTLKDGVKNLIGKYKALEHGIIEVLENNILSFIDSLQEEPVSEKKCMFTKEEFTEEDRKVLCEDCEEECEYAKKEEPVSEDMEKAALLYYPKMSRISEPHGIIPADNESHYLGDANEDNRKAFKAGAQWMHKKMIHELNLKEE